MPKLYFFHNGTEFYDLLDSKYMSNKNKFYWICSEDNYGMFIEFPLEEEKISFHIAEMQRYIYPDL